MPCTLFTLVNYGWAPIKKIRGSSPKFSAESLGVLKAVYDTYSKFDGAQLEVLTHSELPWKEARGNTPPYEPSENVISIESMKTYYAEKYKQAQGD